MTTIGAPSDAAARAEPGIAGERGPVVRFELLETLVTTRGGAGADGAGRGGADGGGGGGGAEGAAGDVCSQLSRIFFRSRCFLSRTAETIHSSKSATWMLMVRARGGCAWRSGGAVARQWQHR